MLAVETLRRRVVFFGLLAIGCVSGLVDAEARLGETREECEERYGEVAEVYPAKLKGSDGEAVHYVKGYFHFFVEFKAGKAWVIKVWKRGLTKTERNELLAAEGVMFEGPETYGGKSFWISERGSVHATEIEIGRVRVLKIMTRDCVKALAKAQQKREWLVGTDKAKQFYATGQAKAESSNGF